MSELPVPQTTEFSPQPLSGLEPSNLDTEGTGVASANSALGRAEQGLSAVQPWVGISAEGTGIEQAVAALIPASQPIASKSLDPFISAPRGRFSPEFSSASAPEVSEGATQVQSEAMAGWMATVPLAGGLGGGEALGQVEPERSGSQTRPLDEAGDSLEQPESLQTPDLPPQDLPDISDAPAGDLLESVDGLENSGIAGEEAVNNGASGSAIPGESLLEGELEGTVLPSEGAVELEADELEADELEADEFEFEEFEADEFEFEEFEFEDSLEDSVPNPPEATVDGGSSGGDPDLGILRLRERPLAQRKPPLKVPVFLVGNVGYIGNGNTLAGVDPVNDRLFRSGVSLIVSPRLSKRTALIASAQGNLYRYDELSRLDYNELRFQASLRHVLTRKVYGDVGWTHRQLFLQEGGDRFLNENAAFASLTRRDSFTKKTSLTSFYNVRASFADPETSSRLRNTLGLSLRHDVTPAVQASLTGRMTLTNFTQQYRQDFYTQGLAQLSYKVSQNLRLSLFGSLTRGNSSNRNVDFDNSTIGVSLSGNLKLF